jgi:hypothetical protein
MATAIHPRLLIIGDDTVKESLSQVSVNYIFTENRFFLRLRMFLGQGRNYFGSTSTLCTLYKVYKLN